MKIVILVLGFITAFDLGYKISKINSGYDINECRIELPQKHTSIQFQKCLYEKRQK